MGVSYLVFGGPDIGNAATVQLSDLDIRGGNGNNDELFGERRSDCID